MKCQLLFGAAVVLILFAALFVPWQRMDELMAKLNERAAGTLADRAVMDHVAYQTAVKIERSATKPSVVVAPTTVPAVEGEFLPPRLLAANEVHDRKLPKFERHAFTWFAKNPDSDKYAEEYDRKDVKGFRYAEPLYATAECMACHTADGSLSAGMTTTREGPATREATATAAASATQPATRPSMLLGIVSADIPSQIEQSQILLNRVFILIAGLLAGTLAIVVFYLITTRLILQPVRVLQETAEKVSGGNLNIRSDINTGDEFQQLSETFNTMLSNLQEGEDQLRAINQSLDLKLGQLAESNVALYESNRLKSEFLANVSHELRTPLNSILGFAELLKDSLAQDPKGARYIQNILMSGKNLLELINDLLDLAKIEAGRMEVRSEPLSLNDLFEGLSSILKPLVESKRLALNLAVAADVPIIQTDPAKLQQVLYNFLSNAIKFSPIGGQIEVTANREADEHVKIAVTDHGPGIEPAQQEMIFEKFRQLDASVTRQHGGTGLGLAISKELVILLSGSIGVRSTPGEGATFWVVLPLKIQAGAQDVRARLVLS